MEALKCVAEECALPYDFVFHTAKWEVDSPVVVASTGRGSLVRTDVTVQLSAEARAALGVAALPPTPPLPLPFLAAARAYLACARAGAYRMGDAAAAWVEAELVAARAADGAVNAEAMHRWLETARLLALSHGESELSRARWEEARALDAARVARAPPPPPPPRAAAAPLVTPARAASEEGDMA